MTESGLVRSYGISWGDNTCSDGGKKRSSNSGMDDWPGRGIEGYDRFKIVNALLLRSIRACSRPTKTWVTPTLLMRCATAIGEFLGDIGKAMKLALMIPKKIDHKFPVDTAGGWGVTHHYSEICDSICHKDRVSLRKILCTCLPVPDAARIATIGVSFSVLFPTQSMAVLAALRMALTTSGQYIARIRSSSSG